MPAGSLSQSGGAAHLGPTAFCFACGTKIDARAEICPRCGVRQRPPTPVETGYVAAAAPVTGTKSRTTAGILGILLGGLGLHKFYLGKVAQGVIYLIFFWTFIPAIAGFIEGLIYLTMSDEEFARRYG